MFCVLFQLNIRINELENKKQIKCTWVNNKFKEEVSFSIIFEYFTKNTIQMSI